MKNKIQNLINELERENFLLSQEINSGIHTGIKHASRVILFDLNMKFINKLKEL